MYAVQQYTTSELSAEIGCQLFSFFRLALAAHATGEDRFWNPFTHPYEAPMQHFVVAERGILISHADVTQRVIHHEGESYRLYGVGEVMTSPVFRREGHGQRVVEAATAYIRQSDADLGMLFTAPSLEPFYGAYGWTALNDPGIAFGDPAMPGFDDAYVMMLYLSSKAQANRAAFERGPIYVGERMW